MIPTSSDKQDTIEIVGGGVLYGDQNEDSGNLQQQKVPGKCEQHQGWFANLHGTWRRATDKLSRKRQHPSSAPELIGMQSLQSPTAGKGNMHWRIHQQIS